MPITALKALKSQPESYFTLSLVPVSDGPERIGEMIYFESFVQEKGIEAIGRKPTSVLDVRFPPGTVMADATQGVGTYIVDLAQVGLPALAAVIGYWLNAKFGRRVRVKFGNQEFEASNVEEVRELIKVVTEAQQKENCKGG